MPRGEILLAVVFQPNDTGAIWVGPFVGHAYQDNIQILIPVDISRGSSVCPAERCNSLQQSLGNDQAAVQHFVALIDKHPKSSLAAEAAYFVGQHHYDPADYDLDDVELWPRFDEYRERFLR